MAERTTVAEKLAAMNTLQQWVVTKGRSEDPEFGNVDDLIGRGMSYQHMVTFSRSRGTDKDFGDIEAYLGKVHLFTNAKLVLLARGFGEDPTHADVSHLDPETTCFRKYREASHFAGEANSDVMSFYQRRADAKTPIN